MKEISLTIPYPPSVNKIYYNRSISGLKCKRTGKMLRGKGLTKEAADYKRMVANLIHYTFPHINFGKKDVKISILSSPSSMRGDNHNGFKIVFDAIELSGIIENDKQIVALELIPAEIRNPPTWDIKIRLYTSLDKILDAVRFWMQGEGKEDNES